MAERFKTSSDRIAIDDTINYSEKDLKVAFESFIQEEPKQERANYFNFSTIAGFAMLATVFTFLVSKIIPGFADVGELLEVLPVLGGILVTMTGLGWFSRNKKKKKADKGQQNPSFLSGNSGFSSSGSGSAFTSSNTKTASKSKSEFEEAYYDSYAMKKSKKLLKSITDKKIAGVCGGLAKYLGVSSTFLRLVFIIATFMGWGSPIILYIGLSLILSKEPRAFNENNS